MERRAETLRRRWKLLGRNLHLWKHTPACDWNTARSFSRLVVSNWSSCIVPSSARCLNYFCYSSNYLDRGENAVNQRHFSHLAFRHRGSAVGKEQWWKSKVWIGHRGPSSSRLCLPAAPAINAPSLSRQLSSSPTLQPALPQLLYCICSIPPPAPDAQTRHNTVSTGLAELKGFSSLPAAPGPLLIC
jgi:hypothetical protein